MGSFSTARPLLTPCSKGRPVLLIGLAPLAVSAALEARSRVVSWARSARRVRGAGGPLARRSMGSLRFTVSAALEARSRVVVAALSSASLPRTQPSSLLHGSAADGSRRTTTGPKGL